MIEFVKVRGHEVVAPIIGKGRELTHPLEDYFADPTLWETVPPDPVEAWFALNEQGRKECIRRRHDETSAITNNKTRTVHEIYTRGANRSMALVPWNQMCVCDDGEHGHLQEHRWTVYHWDPLDRKDGLIVIGSDGHPMEKLWWNIQPDRSLVAECHEDYSWLRDWALQRRGREWEAAVRLLRLKANEADAVLGEQSHKSMLSGAGVDTALATRLEKSLDLAIERGVSAEIVQLDPERAVKILKKVPADHLKDAITDVAGMSHADFIKWLHENYGTLSNIKRLAVTLDDGGGVVQAYEVEPDDPTQGMDADVVIEGNMRSGMRVVKGRVKE